MNPTMSVPRVERGATPVNTHAAAINFPTPTREIWREDFDELIAQILGLGHSALARDESSTAARMRAWVREQSLSGKAAPDLTPYIYEFAAFHLLGPRRQSVAECARRAANFLPQIVRPCLPSLAASYWELYEVIRWGDTHPLPGPPRARRAVELRRLCDDAVLWVDECVTDTRPRPGEVGAWRVVDAGGFRAAPTPLPIPKHGLAELMSQMSLEQAAWRGPAATKRADYMRRRGSLMLLRHAIDAPAREKRASVHGKCSPHAQALVSPVESDLPPDAWRRLGQAFSLLEASAASRQEDLAYPYALKVSAGQILYLEVPYDTLSVTLFDSSAAFQSWMAARNNRNHGLQTTPDAQTVPFIRCWRARADELFEADLDYLREAGLTPAQHGAALAVRLCCDWRWEDLDASTFSELIERLHQAARQLRSGKDLAA